MTLQVGSRRAISSRQAVGMTSMQYSVVALLRVYKWLLSPLLPPACRYVPSCSDYALEAVARYGAIRGVGKATWRVLRCHPFVKGGYDPVERSAVNATGE